MVTCDISFPIPLPDDPKKWSGWSNYNSPNFYQRLCLDPHSNPSNELIEEHCRELLRWWQKKLPLKNQPSNPVAQMLRAGLDESSRFLTEARVELLDPIRRHALDVQLAAEVNEAVVAEFKKYFSFVVAPGVLSAEDEKNLLRFGAEHGLPNEQIPELIEAGLKETGVQRAQPPAVAPAPASNGKEPANPQEEFLRVLRLSGLDTNSMTDDQRDALINMAENLGIDPGEGEDLVDLYLEEADEKAFAKIDTPAAGVQPARPVTQSRSAEEKVAIPTKIDINPQAERAHYFNFQCSLGFEMLLIPSGEFKMGSEDIEAAPHERPISRVSISRFYMSRYLVTNADYEKFDSSHKQKRMPCASDSHPVVYVSSLDAIKFCQWMSSREHKKYRLPTEAEWEYAARGTDGRRYPWGNYEGRADLANFADKNTVFAWSDREIDDGYSETSPVGAFPLGASPFGIEDMAGNVWEWCLDFFAAYQGSQKINPRGPTTGGRRVYRGGSWKSRFNSLRAAVRGSNAPNYSCNDLGFRVACECE